MNFVLMKIKKKMLFISLFFIIQQLIICQIYDNFNNGILDNQSSIVDVGDYLNLSIIITTNGNIFNGTPLSFKSSTELTLNASSYAASCNENYMLVACTEDFLLSKLNINSGSYISLIDYSEYNTIVVSNTSCCISIFEDIVFIVIGQTNPQNKNINNVIKFNIANKGDLDNGPIINTNIDKIFYTFPFDILRSNTSRDISCETILVQDKENEYRLLCIYESKEEKNQIWVITFNDDIEVEEKIMMYDSKGEIGFRLHKIDNYYLRCVLRKTNFDLYIDSNYKIKKINGNSNLTSYESYPHLIAYSNNFVFSLRTEKVYYNDRQGLKKATYFKINTVTSNYYLIFAYADSSDTHNKLYAYYNDKIDYLIFLYQCEKTIKYITFQDNKEMYELNSFNIIGKYKSNEEIEIDISNTLETTRDFGKLYIEKSKTIYSSNASEIIILSYPFNTLSFPIDKDNQTITLNASLNYWYVFSFAFEERNDEFLRLFIMPNTKAEIRTCAFQCGSCLNNYYSCDTCRDSNYTIKNNSDDKNCYPLNQLFEGYIYNSTTKLFEQCYSTCKFCSLMGLLSSSSEHNCLSCADGYYLSYEYLGNCYLNDIVNTDNDIIINNITETGFSAISCFSSSKNYKIKSTKECVTECPKIIPYFSYEIFFVNFTEQEYGTSLTSQYILTELKPPKYFLSNYCYEECPTNSEIKDSTTFECKCKYAFHIDTITQEIICYEVDYCQYDGYKYYLRDTKECRNSCPTGYYQFNFQCYLDDCPSDTTLSSDSNKCESIYNYCHVNEYYQNVCNNEKDSLYILKFDNTNQYLKECRDSLIYTTNEQRTYLYNGICYLNCPENTIQNNSKDVCDCLYFGYYSEINEYDYICYSEIEKCNDKIPVNDIKKCLDSLEDCITKNYIIFNNECYSDNCPANTEIKNTNDNYCLCKYYYYNEDNKLICYESSVSSCEDKNYEYSNPDTLECFHSLEDCYNKNNLFYFNKYCYKDGCPSNYIALSSIINETIKNDFITNLAISDDDINRICVCDIIGTNINWKYTVSEGVYTQECVSICDTEYESNKISNRCIESCLDYKHYTFNQECYYNECPSGTKLQEENGHICICENYFFINDNDELECYDSLEDCKANNLVYYNENNKQCFSSLNNCFSKDFNNYFNKICYNDGCPSGTLLLSDISNNTIKDEFISFLGINSELTNNTCVCDIINNDDLKWTYDTLKEEQECVNNCLEDKYEIIPEGITRKCVNKCDPSIDYVFNNECFKDGCPKDTQLKDDGTRNCICENTYYMEGDIMVCCTSENKNDTKCKNDIINEETENCLNEETNIIIDCNLIENEDNIKCVENIIYPPEYYKDPDKCPSVYNNSCYSKCPLGTCLTQRDNNLVYCVKAKSYMTIINNICFTNIQEIVNNIKNISDNNLYIIPSPNILIKAYTKFIDINDININYTTIYLGECENKLKYYYNLSSDTILYILGIETPNKNKNSSVNVYNYGIYLENGTQLNLSICKEEKIIIYSTIANSSLINLEEAKYFYSYGYDIYNESDNFYNDICSPASINGNNINLKDRYIDFYPSNISMCNDSCELLNVNLTNEKIKCICDLNYNYSNIVNNENEANKEEEYSYTYLEYFLSLINYKIVFCHKLLLTPGNYLKNICFYLGCSITFICILQMFINNIWGIRAINQIIKENEPSKSKLEEKKKEELKKIRENFENQIERKTKKSKTYMLKNNKNNAPTKKKHRTEHLKNIKEKENLKNNKNERTKKIKREKTRKDLKYKTLNILKLKEEDGEKEKDRDKQKKMSLKIQKLNNKKRKTQKFSTFLKKKKYGVNNTTSLSSKVKIINDNTQRKSTCKLNILTTKKQEIKYYNTKLRRKYAYLNIPLNDDSQIDKKELNEVPFTQALRIDKRSICEIFFYIILNKIEIINIFYYRDEYVHLSLSISMYIFSFLLDVAMNCFLYTDDVVSEKYHNDGSLEMFTSLTLSLAANIISSIITYFIEKLYEYSELLDIMVRDITTKKYYYINIIKFRKYLKLKLTGFYIIEFLMCILMTYYITIFCIIYNKTQISIMINYIIGVLESLAISFAETIVITVMRYISLKYKMIKIYRASQYLYSKI